nr:MAG TPA: hypothetical protein [Herelleviridae sp.]
MKKESKFKFVVKLELIDSSEPRKMRFANLVFEAENYTDAEKKGYEYYEEEFKVLYDVVRVAKITQIKFNHVLDTLTEKQLNSDELPEPKLFLIKTGLKYQAGDMKPFAVVSLVRGFGLEEVCEQTKKFIVSEYKVEQDDCWVVKAEETEFFSKSQIMEEAIVFNK